MVCAINSRCGELSYQFLYPCCLSFVDAIVALIFNKSSSGEYACADDIALINR